MSHAEQINKTISLAMRCVIHIGTHKTGTSSIQLFCARNRDVLLEHGVYYPLSRYSPKNLNFIGQRLARDWVSEPRKLFAEAVRTARRRGARTLLLSAESLYAISTFFGILHEHEVGNYWTREHEMVKTLRDLLPVDEVRILCYVRRQDRFLESIYNQMVKNEGGYAGSIHDLLSIAEKMLDYYRHLELWGDVFGSRNVSACIYERDFANLLESFLEHAAGVTDLEGFRPLGERINERLNRDVLEYKRIVNRMGVPIQEAVVHTRVLKKVSNELGDLQSHADFLSPGERRQILDRFADSNQRLAERFIDSSDNCSFATFPASGDDDWEPYPGLNVERAVEIMLRHRRIMGSPRMRLELVARQAVAAVIRRLPAVDALIWPLRRLIYRQ